MTWEQDKTMLLVPGYFSGYRDRDLVLLADAGRDELRVLRAEIEDYDLF